MSEVYMIKDTLKRLDKKYYKLAILVAPFNSGKTELLLKVSKELEVPYINLNLKLSEKLMQFPLKERRYYVDKEVQKLIDYFDFDTVILDNIEILFASHLMIDPLRLLKLMSRSKKVIAAWSGKYEDNHLFYATYMHPEHCRYNKEDLECIIMGIKGEIIYEI